LYQPCTKCTEICIAGERFIDPVPRFLGGQRPHFLIRRELKHQHEPAPPPPLSPGGRCLAGPLHHEPTHPRAAAARDVRGIPHPDAARRARPIARKTRYACRTAHRPSERRFLSAFHGQGGADTQDPVDQTLPPAGGSTILMVQSDPPGGGKVSATPHPHSLNCKLLSTTTLLHPPQLPNHHQVGPLPSPPPTHGRHHGQYHRHPRHHARQIRHPAPPAAVFHPPPSRTPTLL